ncbi:MAG TPA: hypothetical protein VFL27_14395 [Candidatus Dormibacteraeota bacterium]|nr:hypothetical protein [Candidatus Dormibacteraeota bacterium]
MYDPHATGPHAVDVTTLEIDDAERGRRIPVETWSPRGVDRPPLIVYSHYSGGHRRAATFLCSHLASHGYLVASPDHWEVVAREDLPSERTARIEAVIANRVPDIRLLMDHFGRDAVGLAGHSFGGWAVLATPEVDARPASIVAMGAGGSEQPRPGILPVKLTFKWRRPAPALFIAAEDDVPIPLEGLRETFARAPEPKRLIVLRRADHQHFLDDVEGMHEAVRRANFPAEAAWIPAAMRPVAELMTGEEANLLIRGLVLAHFDATMRGVEGAREFLDASRGYAG